MGAADWHELGAECRETADAILEYLAERPERTRPEQASGGHGPRVIVEGGTDFENEFYDLFGERLQYLIIRLTSAGFPNSLLAPLGFTAGIDRRSAERAAVTLRALSQVLLG